MKITQIKRHETDIKKYKNGFVNPELNGFDENGDLIQLNIRANGLVIDGDWYELPDDPDGDYILIENVNTNSFGFYENGGSTIELVTFNRAQEIKNGMARGILNQLAAITIKNRVVDFDNAQFCLVRNQG